MHFASLTSSVSVELLLSVVVVVLASPLSVLHPANNMIINKISISSVFFNIFIVITLTCYSLFLNFSMFLTNYF